MVVVVIGVVFVVVQSVVIVIPVVIVVIPDVDPRNIHLKFGKNQVINR